MVMDDQNRLSDREMEILELVAKGASNKEIAARLVISTNTVKVHLRNIYAKLGANSRTEAAMQAIQNELISVGNITWRNSVGSMSHGESRRAWIPMVMIVGVLLFAIVGMLLWDRNSNGFPPNSGDGSGNPEGMRWQKRADMPTARSGLALTTYENQIYAIGGETEKDITGAVERYDPRLDLWARLADKPIPVAEIQAGVVGGKIYIPGGKNASGDPIASLEVYDPLSNRWEPKSALPEPMSGYSMVAFEGALYLFGGWNGSDFVSAVYRYDPAQDQWSELTPMPTARAFSGAAVVGGVIFVIGGYNGAQALAANEAYFPGNDIPGRDPWIVREGMPAERYAMGMVCLADMIYVVGGRSADDGDLDPLFYSPQQGIWQGFENFPNAQDWQQLGLIPVGEFIYGIGGRSNGKVLSLNMSYQALFTMLLPALSK
jgi:DNA-binding CsgD family transcriptional regulator